MIGEIDELLRLLADIVDKRSQARERSDDGHADAGDRQRHAEDRSRSGLGRAAARSIAAEN